MAFTALKRQHFRYKISNKKRRSDFASGYDDSLLLLVMTMVKFSKKFQKI